MSRLQQRTVFITGGSRGIGRAIALACAREGANVVIAAKTDTPHPKLPGTIHTVAEEIRNAGGQALPLVLDVRDERQVRQRIDEAAGYRCRRNPLAGHRGRQPARAAAVC